MLIASRYDETTAVLDAAIARVDVDVAWPALDPLPEPTTKAPRPYPFDGLGPMLGAAARCIACDVQAPDALAGGSVLAAAALAAQSQADVELPHGARVPLSLFVVTAALSGDRKTATDAIACGPLEERRNEQARTHAKAMRAHQDNKAMCKKGDPEELPPVAQSLTIGKATTEGLHNILRGQSHIGLFTGEGGELLGGYSLREERRSAGLSWLLKAWGGETLDDLTRGGGLSVLPGRRISMHALVQPVLMRQLLADPLANGQGLLARCLIAEPASLAGTRLYRGAKPNKAEAVQKYHAALRELLSHKSAVHEQGDGFELLPRRITLSRDAEGLWIEFYNEIERQQGEGLELAGARAFASKTAEHAARIASVVEVASDPNAQQVSEDTMAGAIEVTSFYMGEHLRLTGAGMEHGRLQLLHTLLDWLRKQHSPVKAADVLQSSPRPVRALKAEGVKKLLDELVQRGYTRVADNGWDVRP